MWIVNYYFLIFYITSIQSIDFSSLRNITELCFDGVCENITQIPDSKTEITLTNQKTEKNPDDNTIKESKIFSLKPQKQPSIIILQKSNNNTTNLISMKNNPIIKRIQTDICDCDLKIASCDINCCCDLDCNDNQLQAFSLCSNVHEEIYDSRYCYNKKSINHNTTKFILEELAENLFCIVYNNLPPTYTINNNVSIKTQQDLIRVIDVIDPENFKWQLNPVWIDPIFEAQKPYLHGDLLWKFDNNSIEPIELLQSGFTGRCDFKKPIKFLEEWKESCLQSKLSTNNLNLFPETYFNFTIIRSPQLINLDELAQYQKCPMEKCISIKTIYCLESFNQCNKTNINQTSCTDRRCENVAKTIRYIIIHNGTLGIIDVRLYLILANVTENFYQQFEIIYEWLNDNERQIFKRSGNPGYTIESPILVGELIINKSKNIETKDVILNRKNNYLTLTMSEKSGECSKIDKYTVNFGENIKLKCKIKFRRNYLSNSTCLELQDKIYELLMVKAFFNISNNNSSKLVISKLGDITRNGTMQWTELFLSEFPKKMPMEQIHGNKIWCFGLITSMRIDIVHSLLSRPESINNHIILGVGMTLANETNISWQKCKNLNCTDNLDVDITSYVSFYDASQPEKIYFANGPDLDISLPYDFFYPFISNSCVKIQSFSSLMLYLLLILVWYQI